MRQYWKPILAGFSAAVLGTLLVLFVWRATNDYADFVKMRQWIAEVQQAQARAAAQAPQAAKPPQ